MDIFQEIVKQIDQNGNVYEVAIVKESDMLRFTIDVEASKPTPYQLNSNELTFQNAFLITQLSFRAETNTLAGFLLQINAKFVPSLWYFLDASNILATQPLGSTARGFDATTTLRAVKDLNIKINQGDKLKFYVYNTHTSAQELYIDLIGFRIYQKIIKPIL